MRIRKFLLVNNHCELSANLAHEYQCLKALNAVVPGMCSSDIEHLKYRPLPKRPTMLFKYEPKAISRIVDTDKLTQRYNVGLSDFMKYIHFNGATEIDAHGNMVKKHGVSTIFKGSVVLDPVKKDIKSVWVKNQPKEKWEQVDWNRLPGEIKETYLTHRKEKRI